MTTCLPYLCLIAMFFPFLPWGEPERNPSALLAFSGDILTGAGLTTTESILPFLFTVCFAKCCFTSNRTVNIGLVLAQKKWCGVKFCRFCNSLIQQEFVFYFISILYSVLFTHTQKRFCYA